MSRPIIETRNVVKDYATGGETVHAVRNVSLRIEAGEFVAVMGASGSGKSTFMNLVGCLDTPTSGTMLLDGVDVGGLDTDQLAAIRNQKIGFVFQQFNLLARTSALDNVQVPLIYAGLPADVRKARAQAKLTSVGLADRLRNTPAQLSGGQQQRVAIARALVTEPLILLADEPTGALDSTTSEEVMGIFQRLNDEGITIMMVTHEQDISEHAKRRIVFRDGSVLSDEKVAQRRFAGQRP
jgi:putative ABC transport system ATP-binding protein